MRRGWLGLQRLLSQRCTAALGLQGQAPAAAAESPELLPGLQQGQPRNSHREDDGRAWSGRRGTNPIPGSIRGQAGQGLGQPGTVEGIPAHGTGSLKSSSPEQSVIPWRVQLQP